ncbi:MAG TPA: hypothetical protein PKL13_04580 [bacterium]|nr:hypothetical protein [bacterium]
MKKRRAQGILEVVIAIYIAVVGVLSIMNLVISSMKVQEFNHNMLIATNLAREGVEIVRNIRDSNWIRGSNWNEGLLPPGTHGQNRSFIINNNYLFGDKSGYNLIYFDSDWDNCIDSGDLSSCKIWLVSRDLVDSKNSKINYAQNIENLLANGCDFSGSGSDCVISNTNFYRMIYIYSICYNPNQTLLRDREFINKSAKIDCNAMISGSTEIGLYVISKVAWEKGSSDKTITISERIYNWR